MKLKSKNIFSQSAVCLTLMAALALPLQAEAGWFSDAKSKVTSRTQTVTKRATAVPGKVKDRIEDVQDKVNELYSHLEENRPLADKLRNSKMVDTLKETLEFLQDQRADYQDFVDQGVYEFRLDMQDLVSNITGIGEQFGRGGAAMERLGKMGELIDKIPASFLYIMHKGVGPQLSELQDQIAILSQQVAMLPQLPNQRQLLSNPTSYRPTICRLETDKETKVNVVVIQGQLKFLNFLLKSIKDMLPSDLVVTADVVAGGGLTMSKNPAPVPFEVMAMVVDTIDLRLENATKLAEAMCPKAE
jgi:hypothetical protein